MRLARYPRTKLFINIVSLVIPAYIIVMILFSQILIDNPQLLFSGQVSAKIVNPFDTDYEGSKQNYSKKFSQFEGFAIIMSAVEVSSHNLHLFALPGQNAQLYRNFSIYMFSNQPFYYEIKIDDQVYQRGYSEWKGIVKASSPYNDLNVQVKLINETNATLPIFYFKNLKLLDSPWEAVSEGEGPPVIEEWIKFTQGEFTMWIVKMIAIQLSFGFFGAVIGTSTASIKADLRGILRLL